MYLETIIDHSPHLQIVYYYETDPTATLLQTTWHELDKFCAPHQPYHVKVEHFDHHKGDLSQTYLPTDCKTWLENLSHHYRAQLMEQFVAYCRHCQPTASIQFFT